MDKLIAQLARLYLLPDAALPADLASHSAVALVSDEGLTRAIVIDFPRRREGGPEGHWSALCAVANTLQERFGFPAPAVSMTGEGAYRLWLSLAEPVPEGDIRRFLAMLRDTGFPDLDLQPSEQVFLPPCVNPRSGKWAAFIHPGMGAAFAEEDGLDMAPPTAAQLAFLEPLESIGKQQFFDALVSLKQTETPAPTQAPAVHDGLLLKDASLEDIVRHLHALGIEPSFRHVLPGQR